MISGKRGLGCLHVSVQLSGAKTNERFGARWVAEQAVATTGVSEMF